MTKFALRPLNTRPIRAEVGGQTFTAVDADAAARRAFEAIDAARPELRPAIAAAFVDALASWTGEPGTRDEFETAKAASIAAGSASLAGLISQPGLPPPPTFIEISASPAPLPDRATIADVRKWVLTWETAPSDDLVTTMLTTEPLEDDAVEATPYELALLALDVDAIAATPILAPVHPLPEIPDGPASGSVTLDVAERAAVRAVAVRNAGLPAGFVYAATAQTHVVEQAIDRADEIAATLEEIAALEPSRVEVWYEAALTRMPVLLVIENFDVPLVEGAIAQWRTQTEAPPDGELLFDVTAARLRLRRVVVR